MSIDSCGAFENLPSLEKIEAYVSKILEAYPENQNTRSEYSKIFNRVFQQSKYDLISYTVDQMLSKRSYYKYKAAFQYGLAYSIQAYIENYKGTGSSVDSQLAADLYKILKQLAPSFDQSPNIDDWRNKVSLYPEEEIRIKKAAIGRSRRKHGRQQRVGKRNSIKSLPTGWQITVCQNVRKKYVLSTVIMALTGCRPAEIGNGVEIFLENDLVMCRIQGAKVSATKGHRTRTIGLDPNQNPLAQLLRDGFNARNINRDIVKLPGGNGAEAVKKFGDNVRYAAQKKLGFKKVSAYSFRHQIASDLRKDGFLPIDIAVVLGHRTTKMRKHYGLKIFGKGGGHGIRHWDGSEKDLIKTTFHEQSPAERIKESCPERLSL